MPEKPPLDNSNNSGMLTQIIPNSALLRDSNHSFSENCKYNSSLTLYGNSNEPIKRIWVLLHNNGREFSRKLFSSGKCGKFRSTITKNTPLRNMPLNRPTVINIFLTNRQKFCVAAQFLKNSFRYFDFR